MTSKSLPGSTVWQPAADRRRAPGAQYTQSLGRALRILQTFRADRPSLSLAEVARAADLDKATVRRLLVTMQHHGFVDQEVLTRKYSLGAAALELGAAVQVNRVRRDVVRPTMVELAHRTGLSVFLGVASRGEALCIERIDPPSPVLLRVWPPGGRLPLNCGAAPRVLLAHLPADALRDVLARRLGRLTAKSIVNPKVLLPALRRIRSRGWDYVVGDVTLGTAALGVPVRDRTGNVIAALSGGGLTLHLGGSARPKFLAALQQASRELGPRLSTCE